MRLPAPAAGMIPHMRLGLLVSQVSMETWGTQGSGGERQRLVAIRYPGADGFKLGHALFGGVLAQGAFAGGGSNRGQFAVRQGEDPQYVGGCLDAQDLLARLEKGIQAFPPVGQDGGSAGGCFKQPAGGAV